MSGLITSDAEQARLALALLDMGQVAVDVRRDPLDWSSTRAIASVSGYGLVTVGTTATSAARQLIASIANTSNLSLLNDAERHAWLDRLSAAYEAAGGNLYPTRST